MKKIFTLVTFAFLSSALYAQQQLPNNGFETWSVDITGQEAPDGYSTTDFFGDNVTKSTDSHGGQFAAQLTTIYSAPDTLIVQDSVGNPVDTLLTTTTTTGGLILGDLFTGGGIPFNGQPIALRVWVKSDMAVNDTAFIVMLLSKNSPDSTIDVGGGAILLTDSSDWMQYETPIQYFTTDTADSLFFIAFSSVNPDSVTENSSIIIDDIELVYAAVSVQETNTYNATVYPNPSNGNVNISGLGGLVGSQLTVTDVAGRIVNATVIGNGEAHVNIGTPGFYFVTVAKPNGEVVLRKKVTVQ